MEIMYTGPKILPKHIANKLHLLTVCRGDGENREWFGVEGDLYCTDKATYKHMCSISASTAFIMRDTVALTGALLLLSAANFMKLMQACTHMHCVGRATMLTVNCVSLKILELHHHPTLVDSDTSIT